MTDIGLFEAIHSTRSMRRLRPDPIPDAVLRQILTAGIHAPSGSNFQNWGFVDVDGRDDKRLIRDHYPEHYRELERRGTIPSIDEISLERQRMFASAIHLAEPMHEAPVILLACVGTDFPILRPTWQSALDHRHAACLDLSGGAEHPARLSRRRGRRDVDDLELLFLRRTQDPARHSGGQGGGRTAAARLSNRQMRSDLAHLGRGSPSLGTLGWQARIA